MKPTRITEANAAAIEAALKSVNGTSEAHTYTTYREIENLAKNGEARLTELGIKTASRAGAQVRSESGGSVPNAYKYARRTTYVAITRRATGWFITAIAADMSYKQSKPTRLHLTKEQDAEAVLNLRKTYVMQTI